MSDYLRREIIHTAFGLGVTVLVALATSLSDIESFETVSLTGLAVTLVRSGATFLMTALPRFLKRNG